MWGATEIEYLGHVISREGLQTDPKKTKAIADWPNPRNQKEVREFLGLTNYYQKFVNQYANKAAPLNDLLRKDKEWEWGDPQEKAFRALKGALQDNPVLRIADPTRPYRMETDMSDIAIGAVLKQEADDGWHPIAFLSRKLTDTEKRYSAYDRKLLALGYALKKWRCYLLGLEIEASTDHHTLTNLLAQKELSGRQARWADMLAEYRVNIIYKPGTQNIVADALSRRAD